MTSVTYTMKNLPKLLCSEKSSLGSNNGDGPGMMKWGRESIAGRWKDPYEDLGHARPLCLQSTGWEAAWNEVRLERQDEAISPQKSSKGFSSY